MTRGVETPRLEAAVLPAGPGDLCEISSLGTTTIQIAAPPMPEAPIETAPPVTP